jgi:hypothetical protein
MSLIRLNTQPSPRDLRVFAALWLVFFSIAAAVAAQRGAAGIAKTLWIVGAVGGTAGLIYPPAMRWIYLGSVYLTFPLGFVMSYAILGAVYYLVLTPTGAVMRLLRYDPLQRRFDSSQRSYWKIRVASKRPDSYFRQHNHGG